jgi:hypothetical protein
MLDYIYPFLLIHKKLQLAGIGTIQLERVSAAVDASGEKIAAPYEKVSFNAGQGVTDASFIAWVATIDHLDIDTATSTTQLAVQDLASSIHLQQPVVIAGVGSFSKEGSGISFKPHEPLYTPQNAIPIPAGLKWSFKKGLFMMISRSKRLGVSTLRSKRCTEHQLSVVNDTGELNFKYEYLREYEAKIENIRYT